MHGHCMSMSHASYSILAVCYIICFNVLVLSASSYHNIIITECFPDSRMYEAFKDYLVKAMVVHFNLTIHQK